MLCSHGHYLISEYFITPKETLHPLAVTPYQPSTQPLATSISMERSILDISYKWNYMVCGLYVCLPWNKTLVKYKNVNQNSRQLNTKESNNFPESY